METNRVNNVLAPLEFRFTEPEDVEKYGDRWYRYSEGDIIRRPGQKLLDLEGSLGVPLIDMMNGMRARTVLGEMAAAWVGVHDIDPELAGEFENFSPMVFTITWRNASGATEGKEPAVPTAPEESVPGTSEPTDIVTLQTSPVVE